MKITRRDYHNFKDDKLGAIDKRYVPLFAQVTHLPFVCKQGVW